MPEHQASPLVTLNTVLTHLGGLSDLLIAADVRHDARALAEDTARQTASPGP